MKLCGCGRDGAEMSLSTTCTRRQGNSLRWKCGCMRVIKRLVYAFARVYVFCGVKERFKEDQSRVE